MSWFDANGAGKEVPVTEVLGAGALDALVSVVDAGALVSVGRTSDGGALGVTVTLDGRWRREYFRDADEATSWLLEAREAVEAEAERLTASSGQGSRSRRARGR